MYNKNPRSTSKVLNPPNHGEQTFLSLTTCLLLPTSVVSLLITSMTLKGETTLKRETSHYILMITFDNYLQLNTDKGEGKSKGADKNNPKGLLMSH
jgi:hypothetical protein